MSEAVDVSGGLIVNKWLAGIFASVIAAGAIMFFVSYQESQTQAAVFAVQMQSIEASLSEIKANLAQLRTGMSDRWTGSQQREHAADVKAEHDNLRQEIRQHASLPWHREAGAEHAEIKRRVLRIEQELDDIRKDIREIAKQIKGAR